MTNKEKIEEILNKQFKQSVFSGYDTYDVDEFFDEVIEYLQENEKRVIEAESVAKTLELENNKLNNQVKDLKQQNDQLQTKIDEFCENGYKNVVENTRSQKTKTIKEGK